MFNDPVRVPAIDLSECIRCGICQDVCPEVFILCGGGYVMVEMRCEYPVARS
ncbi:MAG: 4Fe-4S binding protein [Deltaproteobacteria bacterium]|nr:4Fe-4S binding protein [Deltaproteobacteria bacterium]MBW1962213.1 4Fe-4S binding protein [Deltaproteobacteria bacterium]MBW1993666.1 4Fe-4S binding protein [Deltaproteobacteria bacterium]MBW2150827.1 4Fe-4S binding protein [Deltaproteobacteria bacterium]